MAQSFRTNLLNVATHYIQQLKAPVTKTTLKESLEQNPYYPSLYSISHVFEKFGIANEAFMVDEENLHRLETPFITYCSGQNTGKDFVLVTQITGRQVSYIAEKNKRKQLSKEDFLRQWQKTVFVAEVNAESGEKEYKSKVKIEKSKGRKQAVLYAGIVVLIGLMVYSFIGNADTANIIAITTIALIKLLGVAVTVLLLVYEIDKTNSFVKDICGAGKQTNCDAVLKSKAGKILGISWGEIGFFYFASTTLFLLLPGLTFTDKQPWLVLASSLAAPYIVFSVYYQWKIVKQWCPLCLAVQAVLAMELTLAIVYYFTGEIQNPFNNLNALLPIAGCLLLIILAWYLLKPILLAAQTAPRYNAAYKRLLYNPETFNSLLQQQTAAPGGWQQLGITIGNPDAINTIIKVCNPYCGPCAKAHPVLEEVIKHNKNIKIKVIFTASNNENDRTSKPVKHLLAIAAKQNLQLTEQALDDWYLADKKDYDVFAAKYPINGELIAQETKIDLMKKWCDEAEIAYTPTIFINGRRLPEIYSINELKNIL
jgi:uncharacterized membrane protein/thiol-disulfide isomerase/thioredoxin